MGKIDIIILVILGLFAIIGLAKGFVKQVLSFANLLVAIILAFVTVKPVSVYLSGTKLAPLINEKVVEFLASKGEIFTTVIPEGATSDAAAVVVDQLGLPGFIDKILINMISLDETSYGLTYSEVLAQKIGPLLLIVISFIALVIVIFIVMKLLVHFIDSFVKNSKAISGINKFLGMILGLVKAVIIVSLLMLALSALGGFFPTINDFMITDMKIGIEGFGIGKFVYENNPVIWAFENLIDLDKILDS
ncbi:MAG: CvpA family protein, partial [Bacilli bacterium]|nr:CvpA family protein [Bacilli bacterium]